MNQKDLALIDSTSLRELVHELSYLRITINQEIIPTSENLESINTNLKKTIDSFDAALASKAAEVLDNIDIKEIQESITDRVIDGMTDQFKSIRQLSQFSQEIETLTKSYEANFTVFKKTVNSFGSVVEKNRKNIQKTDKFFIFISFFFGLIFHHLDFTFPFQVMKASLNMVFAYF